MELPYDLLPLPLYSTLQAGRVHLQTSRGCPSRCGFCYNTAFNKRRWRGKSPERVVDEMEWLLRRFPGTKILDPVDDNFFVDRKRVEAICELILSRGLKFRWRANCRFDYLAKYDAEFLGLVERAGCMELDFGGESGSARMQDVVCKEVSADEILTSVTNLRRWAPSIDPFVSWLSGLPGETYADMEKTFDLMDAMGRANPRTQHYGIFLYTPFPSPLLDELPPEFSPPQSLAEWGEIEVFHFLPPWHTRGVRGEAAFDLRGHALGVLSAVPDRRARARVQGCLRRDVRGGPAALASPGLRLPRGAAPGQRGGAAPPRVPVRDERPAR